jgi:F-type H+-transporting ATPase subunit delta
MKHTRVARRYAVALMSVAEEQNAVERVAVDLTTVANAITVSRELRVLIASPVVVAAKKRAVFRDLFAPRLGKETMAFLDLLVVKQREELLLDVAEQFHALHDEKMGIVTADVTTAAELAPEQEQRLSKELERYTGKHVRMRVSLDRTIKGGLLVRIGDTVLDASVRRQLEVMRKRFMEGTTVQA